jgi:hypothetical protein
VVGAVPKADVLKPDLFPAETAAGVRPEGVFDPEVAVPLERALEPADKDRQGVAGVFRDPPEFRVVPVQMEGGLGGGGPGKGFGRQKTPAPLRPRRLSSGKEYHRQ